LQHYQQLRRIGCGLGHAGSLFDFGAFGNGRGESQFSIPLR